MPNEENYVNVPIRESVTQGTGEEIVTGFINDSGDFQPFVDQYINPHYPISYDGKLAVVAFDDLFNRPDLKDFGKFLVEKGSYVKNLELITKYVNYFINYYDKDNELMFAYFKLRFLIASGEKKFTPVAFKKMCYKILFTPTMSAKIKTFVDDNYRLEIDKDTKASKYPDETKFGDIHTKIIFRCSMAIKVLIIPAFHYLYSNEDIKTQQSYLYDYFKDTLMEFSEPGINIYNKLRASVTKMVKNDVKNNPGSWSDKEIGGHDPLLKSLSLFEKDLMIDLLYKYRMNENPVKFNMVAIRSQLVYSNRVKYKHTFNRISGGEAGMEGELSSLDKMMMSAVKIDESLIIISEENAQNTIKKLREKMPIVTDEEIDFYYKYHRIGSVQQELVHYYYAKYFDSIVDLNLITRRQYITLMVLLKRRLMYDKYIYLPQLISGNIDGKVNTRDIRNSKFINELESDPLYQELKNDTFKYVSAMQTNTDFMTSLLSPFINSKFTFVDYDVPYKIGEEIEILNQYILKKEMSSFLNEI